MEIDRYNALCESCWEALGVKTSQGKHISEHITELRQERDFYMMQSNQYYQELLEIKDQSCGFIFWMGGECPVQDGTRIEVIYRCGERKECRVGFDYACDDWRIGDGKGNYDPMDIIAYKVLDTGETNV